MGEQGEGGSGAHEPRLDLPFFKRRLSTPERPPLEVVPDQPEAEQPALELTPEDLAAREAAVAAALAADREARAARAKRAPKAAKAPRERKASRRRTASSAGQHAATGSPARPKPAKAPRPAKKPKAPRAPRRVPRIVEPIAAIVTGAICGLATMGIAIGFAHGCQEIRGVASCGDIGALALLLMLGANISIGGLLLAALRVRDSTSTAFVATGFTAAVVVIFLGSHFSDSWMIIAMPAVTAAIYLISWRAMGAIRATDA